MEREGKRGREFDNEREREREREQPEHHHTAPSAPTSRERETEEGVCEREGKKGVGGDLSLLPQRRRDSNPPFPPDVEAALGRACRSRFPRRPVFFEHEWNVPLVGTKSFWEHVERVYGQILVLACR